MTEGIQVAYTHYPNYEELTSFMRACEKASGGWMRLSSLGTTGGGREMWLATFSDPASDVPESKPAYYVQANAHSHEMCGTVAAMHLMQALLADAEARRLLAETTFYVAPRVNPDGAEHALITHYPNRSRMGPARKRNGVMPQDLNGDGMIVNMRWEDPAGPLAVDPEDERLLVPRRAGDRGPFYFQCTEGLIHEYDGGPLVESVERFDFNRNYPAGWDHTIEPSRYPFEQPETRAIGEFLYSHPNVFAGLDYHGGTPGILYPGGIPGQDVREADLEIFLEIGRMGEQLSGLRLMNSRDYRASWRNPCILPGSFSDFAYHLLGISLYTVEIGWGWSSAGLGPDETFDAPEEIKEREFMRRILKFHDDHADTDTRVPFVPWEDFDHPQLGRVQIGGITYGAKAHVYPPHLEELSAGITRFALAHAAHHPQLALSGFEVVSIGPNLYRIRARVSNVGDLNTNVMSTGLASPHHAPVTIGLDGAEGVEILSRPASYEVASLGRGGADYRPLEWFVAAPSGTRLTVRASHPHGGVVVRTLDLRDKVGSRNPLDMLFGRDG